MRFLKIKKNSVFDYITVFVVTKTIIWFASSEKQSQDMENFVCAYSSTEYNITYKN